MVSCLRVRLTVRSVRHVCVTRVCGSTWNYRSYVLKVGVSRVNVKMSLCTVGLNVMYERRNSPHSNYGVEQYNNSVPAVAPKREDCP